MVMMINNVIFFYRAFRGDDVTGTLESSHGVNDCPGVGVATKLAVEQSMQDITLTRINLRFPKWPHPHCICKLCVCSCLHHKSVTVIKVHLYNIYNDLSCIYSKVKFEMY